MKEDRERKKKVREWEQLILEDDHHDGVLKPHQKHMKTKTWETLMELCNHMEQDEDEKMKKTMR
jgi:hypothetical protein